MDDLCDIENISDSVRRSLEEMARQIANITKRVAQYERDMEIMFRVLDYVKGNITSLIERELLNETEFLIRSRIALDKIANRTANISIPEELREPIINRTQEINER